MTVPISSAGRFTLEAVGEVGPHRATIDEQIVAPGLTEITIALSADEPRVARPLRLAWQQRNVDIQTAWHPNAHRSLSIHPNWASAHVSRAGTSAPVVCLCNLAGQNRLTIACSDAMNAIELRAGVVEETAEIVCQVTFFTEPHAPFGSYRATVRIDERDVPFHAALADVSDGWARQPGYEPASVPDVARLPMYSTWYSFHQALVTDDVLTQVRLSHEMGCRAIIVDDGWQNLDANRGYATCGDWRPLRIPQMRAFVDAVHEAGQKVLLWYAVPFVGPKSELWARFESKLLSFIDRPSMNAGVLDPRFPDVREYLIETYERAMRDWDLDGFKLDFVDAMVASADNAGQVGAGRDMTSVPAAVDRLLSDVIERLRTIKPDVMIEFRQSYVGPLMRKYGNLFRAADCPNDAVTNRIRIVDIRLLCGTTAAHADMLMWHPDEPVETAALQLLNVLFSVPQISMRLDRLPAAHREMLAFYLRFWQDHRDVLLDGEFLPRLPHAHYPVVSAIAGGRAVTVAYDPVVVPLPAGATARQVIVNATHDERLVCDLSEPFAGRLGVYNCTGHRVRDAAFDVPAGICELRVPRSGMAILSRGV